MESRVSGCTATGQQLAARLTRLVGGLLQNDIPATVGRRLSAALDATDERMRRQAALERATAILDGGEGLSRWALAQRLESALARFEAVGYRRVKAGYRKPSETECHLMTLLETDGPRCAGSLWREMQSLNIPDSNSF